MSSIKRDYFSSLPYKILQRRWLVIVPFVLIMSLIFAYTRNVDLFRSSAIVTFHTEYMLADRDRAIKSLFEDKVSSVVGSLRFGEPLRSIAQKVWPDLDANTNPVVFNARAQKLGSSNGIQLAFRRDNFRALTISYTSKDPDEAYRVVQATIETLMEESKFRTERRVASSASFMNREIEESKKKLEEIDQEIARLESGLAPFIDDGNGAGAASDSAVRRAGLMRGGNPINSIKYRELLPKVQFDLKVAEKELERLVSRLENQSYLDDARQLENVLPHSDDPTLSELRAAIREKQKQRNILSSQGFLKLHPKRKALEAEIRNLERLEEERVTELQAKTGEQGFELAKLKLESQIRTEIGNKTEEISRLRDRISVLERYEEEVAAQSDALVDQIDLISMQQSQLEQLKQQKIVKAEAYHQAVSELDIIRRQGRADRDDIGLQITIAEAPKLPKSALPLAHMSTIVMGIALSLAGGIGLVCGLDGLDSSLESTAELREIVPVPVIGETDRMVSAEQRTRMRLRSAVLLLFLLLFVLSSDQIVTRFFL